MPTLHIPAELQNLATIRHFVEETSISLHASQHAAFDLVQAVDEAATNTIVHGYAGLPGDIEVEINLENDRIVVCLRDHAPVFDPTRVPPPDLTLPLEQRPIGGLGIFLIKQSVDEFHHRPNPSGGNELTFIKKRSR